MKSKLFNQSTEHKLEGLFKNLPEIFFWTVVVTRLFIMMPLYLAARVHFDFLVHPYLVSITAFVSVLIVETILTLPSLATPYFHRHRLDKYRNIALRSTLIFGVFNQWLIIQSWLDLEMKWQALAFYSFVNIATIILAELIGVMVGAVTTESQEQAVTTENQGQAQLLEKIEAEPLTTPIAQITDVDKILKSTDTNKQKGERLAALGYDNHEIAGLLGVHRTTVGRWL